MAHSKKMGPKLPAKQLAILAVVRFAEPLALTSVFPYLPEMIQSFGVEKDQIAKWAGLTGAVFSIAQSITAVPWGWASDRIGRKPSILIGLTCTMICFIFWGMSTSLPMAIAVRAIQGGSNGNVGIIRTMVAEMVPEKVLQPRAFSIMPLVWSIGSVFGPSFGGFFARPAEHYPWLFGDSELLKKYPFLLPNLVASIFFLISVATATLFLKETLESKRHEKDWGLRMGEKITRSLRSKPRVVRSHRRSFVDAEAAAPLLSQADRSGSDSNVSAVSSADMSSSTTASIFTYQTVMALICYTFLALHSVAYDQLLPVFLNYPRQDPDSDNIQLPFKFASGFGLSSDKIGTIFTVYGIACGLVQFLLFPALCARFGVLRCYRFAAVVFPLTYLATPFTALVQDPVTRYAVFLAVLLVKGFVVIIGFPCMTITLTNSAPSLRVLGTLNGFATTFSGVGRALGPAATGATFSWGVQRGYIIAGWWLLAVIAAVGAIPPWFLEDGDGPTANMPDREDEEEEEEDDTTIAVDDYDDDEDDDDPDGLIRFSRDHPPPLVEDEIESSLVASCPPSYGATITTTATKTTTTTTAADRACPHMKLRRMSAAGQDLEHNERDRQWRLKRGDADRE